MAKNHVIVTGGAGYIGGHISIALLEAGFIPVIIDDLSNAHQETIENIKTITGKSIAFHQMDVCDRDALKKVFNKYDIAAVIHLAAKKAVEESVRNPLLYYSSNLNGLLSVLQVMEETGVSNLVYSSSATVYAPTSSGYYAESARLGPVNPYGATKLMGEQIISDIAITGKLCAAILRYFNPVGAHESGLIGENPKGRPNNLMPILGNVITGKIGQLTIYGDDYDTPDGTAVRDYIHVMDVAEAHVAALKKILNDQEGFTLNIGTGHGASVLEIIRSYETSNDVKIPYTIGPRRAGDAAHVCADTSLATANLGWVSKRGVDEMCRDLHRWIMRPEKK